MTRSILAIATAAVVGAAIGLMASMLLVGCAPVIPKEAIKAEVDASLVELAPQIETRLETRMLTRINMVVSEEVQKTVASGDVSSSGEGIAVGTVAIDGGTGAIVAIAVLSIVVFLALRMWRKKRTAVRTVDTLVGEIERHEPISGKALKMEIMKKAVKAGIAEFLDKRVQKVTKPKSKRKVRPGPM